MKVIFIMKLDSSFAQPMRVRRRRRLWTALGGLVFILLLSGGLLNRTSYAAATGASAVVRSGGANLYAAPDGAELDTLAGGTIVSAIGRSADLAWIVVQGQDGTAGWVPAAVLLTADIASLPVMDTAETASLAPDAPVSLSTVTPTPMPTPTALPTPTTLPTTTLVASDKTAQPQPAAAQPVPAQTIMGIVAASGADLLDAPDGTALARLTPGLLVNVVARSDDSAWVLAQRRDDVSVQGWIATHELYLADVTRVTADAEAAQPETVQPDNAAADRSGTVYVTVASDGERLNIRSGPSTTYDVIAKAVDGERYTVIARNTSSTWLQLDTTTGHAAGYGVTSGWVAAEFVTPQSDVDMLPVGVVGAQPSALTPDAAPIYVQSTLQNVSTATAATSAPSAQADGLSGTLVIQTSPGGAIYGYSLDTGALWPVTSGFDPALSPDGQTVAFVRDGGENGVYLVDIDGSNERLIFSGRARLSAPKWSPDGAWIVFTRGDEYIECYQMGFACVTKGQLPPGMEINESEMPLVRQYNYKLARIDHDGNNYRDLATLESARAADWNEAGIVYQSAAGLQITRDTPDAENRLVVFDYLKPHDYDPDWQPQGGKIVYMGKEGGHWEIFTINPDGSGQTALTRPVTTLVDEIPSNVAPAWSPDGQHIFFLSNRTNSHTAGPWRLWVMDADGSNQRALPLDLAIDYTFGGEQSVS